MPTAPASDPNHWSSHVDSARPETWPPSSDGAFHLGGHHVQKAHGRRVTQLAADSSHLSGGMIALMPTAADAKRLALGGGEAAADLHCTLFYLGNGDMISGWTPEQKTELISAVRAYAGEMPGPVTARIFGIAHWNAGGEDPSWVWSVGDDPESEIGLSKIHAIAAMCAEDCGAEVPGQHTPWCAHICAAYTSDLSLAKVLEQRLGGVTFDRIRVSFGEADNDAALTADGAPGYVDIPLTAAADGPLRRELSEVELRSGADFIGIHRAWENATTQALGSLSGVLQTWRRDLHDQIVAKLTDDNPEALPGLSLDTLDATSELDRIMEEYALRAGQAMQREAEKQGVTVPEWHLPEDTVTAAVGGKRLISSVARMTSDLMASNMITAAKRKLSGLLGTPGSPEQIAAQVGTSIATADEAGLRGAVSSAMTVAQNIGRRAVLEVAPTGSYYASEVMDKRTCKPCAEVDGEEFSSLYTAIKAYPVMGYEGCQGTRYGNSCRGFIVANWASPDAEIASAAATMPAEITEGDPPVTETLGGKPNPGTKKDKRLDENAYDMDCPEGEDCGEMAAHFAAESVEMAWDGAASRFTDPEYRTASAGCDPGNGSAKQLCFLPHHEPGGALNKDGLHAAAQRVSSLSGHDPAAVARAKAHLRSHYKAVGEDAPDSIRATIEDEVELAFAAKAQARDAATVTQESGQTAPWRGPLTIEGKVTGDGREFAPGALDWADLPLPLRWNRVDSHGGEPHTEAVNVGNITHIWRDGDLLMGEGLLDLADADGQRVHHKIEGKFLRGVSIDADSIANAQIEYVMPEGTPTGDDADLLDLLTTQPEKMVYHGGRIRGATICDIPAFAEAYVELLDESGAVVAGGQRYPELVEHRGVYARTIDGLVADGGGPRDANWMPPADWFSDPKLSVPTGITVDDYGRVYGHAAMWGACHIGQEDVCIQPPHEDSHPYYMTGEVKTREGGRVAVGQITVGTGHAPLSYGAQPAAEHYDNTGSAVADVAVGNDAHGIWVAGALRPGADPLLIHELRASGQVSGDWRRIGGKLRMVGLLAVNVPGFPVPKTRALVSSGEQQALVAAGRPTVVHTKSEQELIQQSFRTVMDMLFARVHEGRD